MRYAHIILWIGLVVASWVFISSAGLPAWAGFISLVIIGFVGLWVSGEAEDKVLVKHRGEWK